MAKARKRTKHAPRRKQRGSSWPLGLVLLGALAAYAAGIINVQWTDGRPRVSVNTDGVASVAASLKELVTPDGSSASGRAGETAQPAPGESAQPAPGETPQLVGDLVPLPPIAETASQAGENPLLPPRPPTAPPQTVPAGYVPGRNSPPPQTIRIASFNIQVFGQSKLQKAGVMQVLTSVVRRFDVVAIQEVRSADNGVLPTFVGLINAQGAQYDFVIGPRLGRTNSKEQYAIVFDTARIEVARSSVYTVPDPQDLLHREPMVAQFRVRGVPPEQAWTFSLVDIHTDPDETAGELNALADVFVGVQRNGSGEDDVILLGDLNVDEYHLGNLGRLPDIQHVVTKVTTNTRHTKMYDNLVFNRRATTEFTGRWGVLDLMSSFGLSEAQALEVSDHCPIWAEFSAYESNAGPLATGPTNAPR